MSHQNGKVHIENIHITTSDVCVLIIYYLSSNDYKEKYDNSLFIQNHSKRIYALNQALAFSGGFFFLQGIYGWG